MKLIPENKVKAIIFLILLIIAVIILAYGIMGATERSGDFFASSIGRLLS